MENKKIHLEKIKTNKCGINMKKEYEEYKKLLMNDKMDNCAKLLDENIEKKWLETKMPLLKRQPAFNKSESFQN